MRRKPRQRFCACKHALAFAVAVYTVSVSGRALSNRQQLREPATPDFLLDHLSQPGQRNPALTDIQSWDTAGTANQPAAQDKGPSLLTSTTSGLSLGAESTAVTLRTNSSAVQHEVHAGAFPAASDAAKAAAPAPDDGMSRDPIQAISQSPGLLAVIADLPGDDSPAAAAVQAAAVNSAADSRPAAGTAGMSTDSTAGSAADNTPGSTAASASGSTAGSTTGSTTGRTGGSPASALGSTVSNATGSKASNRAAAAGQWPMPDTPLEGGTGLTLRNIADAQLVAGTTAGSAASDSTSTTDLASAAATAGTAAAGNAVLGGTANGGGGRKAGGHSAVVAVSSQAARSSLAGTAPNGTRASGCSRNSSRCASVSESTHAIAVDASALRDSSSRSSGRSSSSSSSSSSASVGSADSNSSSSSADASPSVKPQWGRPSADGATVVTEEGAFHVPERCIIAGSALFSSCALEIYAAQSHFFNLTGPYMGPANYTQLLSEQGVSQTQVLQYLKEALASPSDNCCAALCCFNQLLLCDCEPPVLQLAVSFTGVDEGFYALMSRQLSISCGIQSFFGDSCPAVLAYPGSSAAACTGATWPPVHRQHSQQSGSGSSVSGADGSGSAEDGPSTEVGHAGMQPVGGSPTIVCMASTEEDEGMPEG